MAANIAIPPELKNGLEKIHSLSAITIREIVSALKEEKPSLHYGDLVSRVESRVKSCPKADTRSIVFTILGIYSGTTSTKIEASEFIEAISQDSDLDIPDKEREAFRKRLTQLLGLKAIEVTAKALSVFVDHERTFQDARIVTDIRPIFERDAKQEPKNSVVVHVMKLSYQESQGTKEFYVAMDLSDLNSLKKVVDRAIAKEKSATSFLSGKGMDVLS